MTTAISARTSQVAALMVVPHLRVPTPAITQLVGLAVYAPTQTKFTRISQIVGLVPYTAGSRAVPRTSQFVALVVYGEGVPDQSRSRAWTFTLDGHTFYVLNLAQEGTYVYDTVTKYWAKFSTDGFGQWNMNNGTMWGNRIVAGDTLSSQVWELDPAAVQDEGWRDIFHIVTGGLATRSRVYHAMEAVRLNASIGQIDDVNGATLTLNFSDDQGKTWSDDYAVALTEGSYSDEIAWRSLGSFAAPGRIIQITDTGGLIRIDGCDAFIDDFDVEDPTPQGG